MGTSQSYGAPTSGGWPPLKGAITRFGSNDGGNSQPPIPPFPEPLPPVPDSDALSDPSAQRLLSRYIAVQGGAAVMAGLTSGGSPGRSGSSRASGGGKQTSTGSQRAGKHVTRVGQRLGYFAGRVSAAGLSSTLKELDLANLVGKPSHEVLNGIMEWLTGPGSTMDANLARTAMNKLRQEILGTAKSFEDVERTLKAIVEKVQVQGLLMQYYSHYLYEKFTRDFYESLVHKIGIERARNSVESIRRTIFCI